MRRQSGSILVWILVAVALFAALSFTIMESSRTSASMMTDTQARLYATEIIAYGNDVRQAVQKLRIRGCQETQISFENNTDLNYVNNNAPHDKTCHIFDARGGGLSWAAFPADIYFAYNVWSKPVFTNFQVSGFGQSNDNPASRDLVFEVGNITKEICLHINKNAGVDHIPISEINIWYHQGIFSANAAYMGQMLDGVLTGKAFGCYAFDASVQKQGGTFYQVLIAR